MKNLILLKTALRQIERNPGRSVLTILGITVGVAAIIITFSIGRGAEEKIMAQIKSMGEGTIMVLPGNVVTPGGTRSSLNKTVRLTVDDLTTIKEQVPEIREISRGTFGNYLAERGRSAVKEQVVGADPNIFEIFTMSKIAYGIEFTEQHQKERANVVIIGPTIQKKLFGKENALSQTIRIKGFPFVVIGILQEQPHYFGTDDPNAHIFLPFLTAKKIFKQEGERDEDLGYIACSLYTGIQPEPIVRKIKRILRFNHKIGLNEPDDFLILDQESIAETASKAGNVIKLFGLIAASISLLVGGIGIMNIMLVSVQERIQEIGLRIAIGATKKLVTLQFLYESASLCAFGGVLGIIIGLLGQWIVSSYTVLPSVIEVMPPIIALLVTITIGLFFGYYPARKASELNPIDALLER